MLPVGVMPTSETQVFPGFPGRWTPGEPQAVRAVGLTEDEAADLLDTLGLPLEWHDVDELPADLFATTAGLVSSADLTSTPVGQEPPPPAEGTDDTAVYLDEFPRTHADLDKLAAEHAFTWPDSTRTVVEKQQALAAAGIHPEPDETDDEATDDGETVEGG